MCTSELVLRGLFGELLADLEKKWAGVGNTIPSAKSFCTFVSLVLSLDRAFPPLAHPIDLCSLGAAMVAGGADDQHVSFSVRHLALLTCCLQLGVVWFEKGLGGHPAHWRRAELGNML